VSSIAYERPEWIFWDVGLTLIHPSASLIKEALGVRFPERTWADGEILGALVGAAEARHLSWPVAVGDDDKVHRAWAALLGLPIDEGAALLQSSLARTDLYCELDPSAAMVFDELGRLGVRMGVISNSDGTLEEELAHFGLASYFDVVIDSGRAGVQKPNPSIFRMALDAADTAPGSAWHVGDGLINDYLGAGAVGMKPILLDRHGTYVGALPAYRISRLSQLLDIGALVAAPRTKPRGRRT
jgi:FMN phosphatase YigB (HAD superfamily)